MRAHGAGPGSSLGGEVVGACSAEINLALRRPDQSRVGSALLSRCDAETLDCWQEAARIREPRGLWRI